MNKIRYKVSFFLVLLVIVILFFIWSRLFWISLSLTVLADILSTQFILTFVKKNIPIVVYTIIKYCGLLALPIFIAIFIRTFFFDIYFVPSSSMERTLSPNDYVLVNKFLYGAKIPNYRRDIPVMGSLFKDNKGHQYDLYDPLKAFKSFSREDIVVFKSTETNTKFLVKRIIGLPGDTLQIRNTDVIINSNKLQQRDYYCYNYSKNKRNKFGHFQNLSNSEYKILSKEEKTKLKINIKDSTANSYFIFPYSKNSKWTLDNYGKVIIPKKEQKIRISSKNYDLYKTIIKNYEKEPFQLEKGEQKTYTFKNNYYFMMGDNRHNSRDSRSYGFVPESYIQGKMINKF